MAKNRMINTKFWDDTYVSDLDPIEKLMFLYLLTNTCTNICGVYEIPLKKIAVDTGLDKEMVTKIINRFSRDEKIFYHNGWIVLKNFIKHQNQNSPKVKKGIETELESVPDAVKEILYRYPIDTLSHLTKLNLIKLNSSGDKKSPNTSRVKFSLEDKELAETLVSKIRLNTPTFKEPNIDSWADNVRLMREVDGRTYEQVKFVIEWCQKDNFWSANILSTKKLREKFDTLVAHMKREADKNKVKKINVIL